MNAMVAVRDALLVVGVGTELLCCLGLVVTRSVYDRLHFVTPATGVGAAAIVAAIVVQEGMDQGGLKALLVLVLFFIGGPVLGHATARAARIREFGDWRARPEDQEQPS